MTSGNASLKGAHEIITLATVAAATASANVTAVRPHWRPNAYLFCLDLTDAQDAAGDLLDVYIDTAWVVGGVQRWCAICRFTQILGNGANDLKYANKVSASEPMGLEIELSTGIVPNALIAGQVVHIIGDELRVRYVITNGGGAHTFSFTVYALPM